MIRRVRRSPTGNRRQNSSMTSRFVQADRAGVVADEGASEDPGRPARHVVALEAFPQIRADVGHRGDGVERDAAALASGREAWTEGIPVRHGVRFRPANPTPCDEQRFSDPLSAHRRLNLLQFCDLNNETADAIEQLPSGAGSTASGDVETIIVAGTVVTEGSCHDSHTPDAALSVDPRRLPMPSGGRLLHRRLAHPGGAAAWWRPSRRRFGSVSPTRHSSKPSAADSRAGHPGHRRRRCLRLLRRRRRAGRAQIHRDLGEPLCPRPAGTSRASRCGTRAAFASRSRTSVRRRPACCSTPRRCSIVAGAGPAVAARHGRGARRDRRAAAAAPAGMLMDCRRLRGVGARRRSAMLDGGGPTWTRRWPRVDDATRRIQQWSPGGEPLAGRIASVAGGISYDPVRRDQDGDCATARECLSRSVPAGLTMPDAAAIADRAEPRRSTCRGASSTA